MQSVTMLLTVFDRGKFHCHPCLMYHTPADLIRKTCSSCTKYAFLLETKLGSGQITVPLCSAESGKGPTKGLKPNSYMKLTLSSSILNKKLKLEQTI